MAHSEIVRLHPASDAPRLQRLLEQCSDYYVLHEGCATPEDAGQYELAAVPDGRSADDLYVFGMTAAAGELSAVAQVLRDHPVRDAWWIALLLVAPRLRGGGLGSQLLDHVTSIARAAGGQSLQLAVSIHNPRGHAFWKAAAFEDTGELAAVQARSGHVDTVRFMFRELRAAPRSAVKG